MGLILLIAFSSLILEKYKLVPYIPVVLTVYRGNHILKYDVNLLDSEHKQNIRSLKNLKKSIKNILKNMKLNIMDN